MDVWCPLLGQGLLSAPQDPTGYFYLAFIAAGFWQNEPQHEPVKAACTWPWAWAGEQSQAGTAETSVLTISDQMFSLSCL